MRLMHLYRKLAKDKSDCVSQFAHHRMISFFSIDLCTIHCFILTYACIWNGDVELWQWHMVLNFHLTSTAIAFEWLQTFISISENTFGIHVQWQLVIELICPMHLHSHLFVSNIFSRQNNCLTHIHNFRIISFYQFNRHFRCRLSIKLKMNIEHEFDIFKYLQMNAHTFYIWSNNIFKISSK